MTNLEKLLLVVGAITTIYGGIQHARSNSLAERLTELEEARFAYVAEIEGVDLILRNVGDTSLQPDSVRVIPIFGSDYQLDPSDLGLPIPIASASEQKDGSRVLPNLSAAICRSPRYMARCAEGSPIQVEIVFEFQGQQERSAIVF